jgi:hypothetical protein
LTKRARAGLPPGVHSIAWSRCRPAWRTDARGLLAKSIYDAAAVDGLMRDLASAGLLGAS